MVHPLGDYACQPSDSTVVAHALTACYYMNGAAYTSGQTQSISNSCAKVSYLRLQWKFLWKSIGIINGIITVLCNCTEK